MLPNDESTTPPPAMMWLQEVKTWIAVRLEDEQFARLNSPGYPEHLYARVSHLRSAVLTEAEFLQACRGTAWGLIFRTQIFLAGSERQADLTDVIAAMFAVLPEYPSFYSFEDAVGGSAPIHDIAKMQMLEGEMFSVVARYLSQDAEWFAKTITETQSLASKYWEDKNTLGSPASSQDSSPPPIPTQAAKEPIEGSISSLGWYAILAFVGVIWSWNSKFYYSGGGEALGYDIVSIGLPLLLLSFAVRRLRRELVRMNIVAPYKLIFGSLCIVCALIAIYDRLNPETPHKLGAVILTFFFSGLSVVLFWLAYKQRRTSSL